MSLDYSVEPLRLAQRSADADPHLIVEVQGEFDIAGAPEFAGFLHERLVATVTRITLDLRGLSFLDSSGVGQLVGVWKLARSRGTALRLVVDHDRSAVRSVVRLVHLEDAIPVLYVARGEDLPVG